MPGNRTHINHTLQNELSPFEKIRKIEWASFWFFLAGFLISLFGLIVSLGMNIYLPTLIFFFTFILLLILVGLKAISYPSSEKENQIISTLFNYLISQTLTEGTFKLQGEIPVKDIRESLLFFDYIHYHKGYRITGLLNQQPINIYQLQLQKEENDAYYEGCFMSGTCINPFKSDVFIYHPSVDKTEEFENKKKAYCGSYSRSGQMDFVTNTLESFCFSNLLARNWGTSQHTPYNPLIHIHTTNTYGIKG
ncbi:MAG: hypothetical protein LIP01_16460, partial [Tannerellaceae bacterium]|nr:hypothetical protein [Tannerellaceae bacterium]